MTEGVSRLALRRGGVTDLVTDLVRLRPLCLSFPLLFRGGVMDSERLLFTARVRDGDRDLEYEDPVYDE